MHKKKKILVFIGHYLPGFKSGGILRSVENTVNHLSDEFDFFIVTRDHDLGDNESYSGIVRDKWQDVGKAKVLYLDAKSTSFSNICRIINNTSHDVIHLNSFFDPLTVKVLFGKKIKKIKSDSIILSPRGEFAWASLKIKYLKKYIYIRLSKLFRFYDEIVWHSSSKYESADIIKVMGIDVGSVLVAKDLALKADFYGADESQKKDSSLSGSLNMVFLSRISPEKNLDYALKVIAKVKSDVVFDIYGTIEDKAYWLKCNQLIEKLPKNICINFCGALIPDTVVFTLSKYDLFFLPSGGENYGHVIAESLSAGTPVLISNNTPWENLEENQFGWDIDLDYIDNFVEVIERVALMGSDEIQIKRINIRENIKEVLNNKKDLEANKQLFLKNIS